MNNHPNTLRLFNVESWTKKIEFTMGRQPWMVAHRLLKFDSPCYHVNADAYNLLISYRLPSFAIESLCACCKTSLYFPLLLCYVLLHVANSSFS